MKFEVEVSLKDGIIIILLFCLLVVSIFNYRQVRVNTQNISTIAVATGLVKGPVAPQPKGGPNDK